MTAINPPARQLRCPDCSVRAGMAHLDGCDVARCMATGTQRLDHGRCRCAADVWTGAWPGDAECLEFGWTFGPGMPDLNRLYTEATWNPARKRWVRTVAERPDPAQLTTGKDDR
jgi:hypothetical protein